MKEGTADEVIDRLPVPTLGGVVADERVALTTPRSADKYEHGRPLRRVEVVTPEGDRLVFLTNHLEILKYLQLKATFGWSLSNLVALLRMNLFVYRDLWTWLNDPFAGPPLAPEPVPGVLI